MKYNDKSMPDIDKTLFEIDKTMLEIDKTMSEIDKTMSKSERVQSRKYVEIGISMKKDASRTKNWKVEGNPLP